MTARQPASSRATAYRSLLRIEHEGAYANLVALHDLERSGLDPRDKAFATDMIYGTTRMRRACDFAIDRFLLSEPQPEIRTLLRLGAYQLLFAGTAPHAAVSATVNLSPARAKGFVNAVLRKLATHTKIDWPDDATRLSYPDWIVDRLRHELGDDDALAALAYMNKPATANERADGYTQDPASQWVTEMLDAQPSDRILDLCAAPGGKATALAADGAFVVASDLRPSRVQLMAGNVARTRRRSDTGAVSVLVADGRRTPFAPASFDKVLLDAPCSGLGVLRRRADARWRVTPTDLSDLERLQQELIDEAQTLVKPGGVLLYSVCTLTAAESIDHRMPEGWTAEPPTATMWQPYGDGGRVLPHLTDGDGMTVRRYRRPS